MDNKVMRKLTYGLFVLTARENDRDNGCIINTAIQVASEPNTISIYGRYSNAERQPSEPRLHEGRRQ